MAVTYNLTVRADRDYYLPVSVITGEGHPADFSGYQVTMTVKKTINDDDATALFKSSTPFASRLDFGEFTFKIPRSTNNSWWVAPPSGSGAISSVMVYDVTVQDVAAPPNWTTMLEGSVTVIGPVTRIIP